MKIEKVTKNNGFTLAEMAIGVVIIGMIFGGIFLAKGFLESANLKAQLSQFSEYDQALAAFMLEYNAIPGDMKLSDLNSYGFTAASGAGSTYPDIHNGNKRLNNFDSANCNPSFGVYDRKSCLTTLLGEPQHFFIHLSDAELIKEEVKPPSAIWVAGEHSPKAKINNGGIAVFSSSDRSIWYYLGVGTVTNQNHFNFLQASVGITTPQIAYALDLKADDGKPDAGNVQAIYTRSSDGIFQNNAVATDYLSNNLCTIFVAGVYSYDTDQESNECQLGIRSNVAVR